MPCCLPPRDQRTDPGIPCTGAHELPASVVENSVLPSTQPSLASPNRICEIVVPPAAPIGACATDAGGVVSVTKCWPPSVVCLTVELRSKPLGGLCRRVPEHPVVVESNGAYGYGREAGRLAGGGALLTPAAGGADWSAARCSTVRPTPAVEADAAPKSFGVAEALLAVATVGDGLAVRSVPATSEPCPCGRTPMATAAMATTATAPSALAPLRRCWRLRAPAWMRSIASGGTGTLRPRECRTSRSRRSKSSRRLLGHRPTPSVGPSDSANWYASRRREARAREAWLFTVPTDDPINAAICASDMSS